MPGRKTKLIIVVMLLIATIVYSQNIEALKLAAEAGDPSAQVNLGNAYYLGEGVPKNLRESVRWYTKAAEQGNAEGQFNLGYAYLLSEGIAQDDGEAAYWFMTAAEQDHPDAQYLIAVMLATGRGVTKNLNYAARYYSAAAAHGHSYAQYELGLAFMNGRGVKMDPFSAYVWYAIAYDTASQNNDVELMKKADSNRALVALELSSSQVIEARLKAMEFSPTPSIFRR
jgi:hypothetical protein